MTEHTISTVRLTLERSPYCGKITVSMEAFFDFSFEMAEELEDLIAQHRQVDSDLRKQLHERLLWR